MDLVSTCGTAQPLSAGLFQRRHSHNRRLSHSTCNAFGRGGGKDKGASSVTTPEGFKLSTAAAQPVKTVEPAPPPPTQSGPSVPLLAAGGLGIATVAAFLFKKLRASSAESMYGIESTSYGDPSRRSKDFFNNLVLKNMNTTTLPELSEEMVAAARARRQKERANHKLSLEDVELPENHPWAIKAQVSPEEDEAVRARLRIRPRVRPSMHAEEGSAGGPRSGRRIVRSRPGASQASSPLPDSTSL
ncbi:hypothetical protein DUNSADRAFT_16628 [Dunaliella salina]|uniref:Uncharacterized protein n=1 Tax=Dunaliella salina TaxID=3046 RepID=A0ABQ7G370_DUNSA|nr:hypothetical protein DUNSADRAFT_16628 [Dunaliella salina]|eukprot:KAF5829057.1 hypothetical protein DUNSADRAFT_16628 [Dunaliella salina]